jgi:hypothetical protein
LPEKKFPIFSRKKILNFSRKKLPFFSGNKFLIFCRDNKKIKMKRKKLI